MKSKYIRAICLGAAGLLVISTAAINNHKQSEDVTAKAAATASVIEESAETADAGVTAGIASVTAQALASDEDVATVSDTDTELTAAAQEEVTSVYGYTNLGIAVVDSGNLNVRETPGTDATLVGKMPNHAACEVLGVDGEWTQIQSGEVTGYVKTEYLVTGNEAAALAEQVKETVAKVTTTTLYVREEPNTDCSIVTSMPMGEELEVVEQLDGLMQSAVLVTGPLSKGFFSLGDQTHADALPMDTTKTTNWFYFLSNIELMTAEENHTVICYGDSITAGAWPDYLTLLARQNPDNHTAFIRRATSGSRVLRQYECITYDSYGLKGTNRFPHEIPTTGADTVIIQQGINDIIHPIGIETNPFRPMSDLPTAKELIDGYRYYIEEAKKLHLKVYMGTLLPIFGWRTYATFRDDLRNELNAWIRSAKEIDGCIDFDLALRGSENPSAFREGFDSGDHLHPSSKAYQAMAECAYEVLRK